jgi:Zn-dependent protease with chaperone function
LIMNKTRASWTGKGENGQRQMLVRMGRRVGAVALALVLVLAPVQTAMAERTPLKPGWNMFTPSQDIQIGKEASGQAEKQVPMLNDRRVDEYLGRLGQRIASRAPGYKYPYQYKAVNDRGINAFALPGGPVYINRGIIEMADNEAQLAGVMAHETAHVALRHGTNQATKANAWQIPLGVFGAAVGADSLAGMLAQLGAGFTINSILLKYSRNDETQADVMGTQILYDLNYDPRAMGQFFEKLLAESKGKTPPQFFSSHPNPGNRMARVDEEVVKLGGTPKNYTSDSAEFRSIKQYVLTLAPPPKAATAGGAPSARPTPPSEQTVVYRNDELELRHPNNWKASGQASAFSLSPDGGVVQDSRGQAALAYGVIANMFGPQQNNGATLTLEAATDQLIVALRQGNPNLRIRGQRSRILMDGNRALSVLLTNDSPLGGQETDWLVTTMRPDGLLYFICVAPEQEYGIYRPAFQRMISTVRLRR